ncbi:DUF1697 domain-containing protein [Nakamurella sp. GG22]
MTTHIALIRGINVGTGNRVAMAALREMLAELGYSDVRTLLNSGNAVFRSDDSPKSVAQAISRGLAGELKVPAEVIVRSRDQLVRAMDADPIGPVATDGSRHFLGFLAERPSAATAKKVAEIGENADTGPDVARLVDDHLYLWCPNGISKATFKKQNWDKAFGTPVTIRNWNTVTKLVALAEN